MRHPQHSHTGAAAPCVRRALFLSTALATVLALGLLLSACGSAPRYASPAPPPPGSPLGQGVVSTARSVIGTPYAYGGASPYEGFDCSGLAYWAYATQGAPIPRSSGDQLGAGRPVDPGSMQPGDLVFFDVDGSSHVGIYAGYGAFIHSPKTGGRVREEDMGKDYWRRRFVAVRRMY